MFLALYGEIMALVTEFKFWKILNELRLFLHKIISLSNELFYFECL